MADNNSCPSKLLLEQFFMGQLPPVEVEQWAGHVEQCGECIKTLDGLKAEDTITDGLQHPGNAAEERGHELVQAMIGEFSGRNVAPIEPTFLSGVPASAAAEMHEPCDFLGPAQGPDELGRLGPYRVLKVLGAGGMGVVFQAEDPLLKRPVALKAMLPALAASATAKQRFLREAQSAAALKHDHIVTIYQVGEDRGVPFLAMEFLEGETLEQRLDRERTLTIAEVARIGREIAEGLAVAHKRGLIHRDIKPANVWLESASDRPSTGGRAKILDFGLARAANDDAQLTSQGAIVGTPAYMAPEQATGDKVDNRSDLFSLGCVLYRMCTGQAPFRGKDAVSTLLAVAGQQPPRPMEVNPNVPAPLSEMVMQLLAKQPDERPQSAQVVVEALQALVSVEMSANTRLENSASTFLKDICGPGAKATKKFVAVKSGKEKQPPWKNRQVLIAAAFLGVLILAGIIISLTTKDGTLIVEVNQPDAMVQVLDLEGKVEVSQRGGAGKVSIGIDPGKHRLKVEKDGFTVFGQEFEMGTGGKKTIIAKLEPNKPAITNAIKAPAKTATTAVPASAPPIASPFDRFRREDISPYELKAAGMGDAAQAPSELVGIIGDSRFRHFDSPPSVAFTPDGKKLASCEHYGPVVLWDAATGETQWRVLPGFNCHCVVFSPDGTRLAVAGPNPTQVILLDATNGKKVREFLVSKEQDKGITSLAFTHDGKQLVGSGQPKEVFLWDVATGHEIRQFVGHTDMYVDALSLSPDDKLLVTGGKDKTVRVWDVATGQELRQLQGISAQVVDAAFLPDGKRVLVGFNIGNNRAGVWDVSTGTRLLELAARKCVTASSDGKYWAACDDSKGSGRCEIVWFDAATGNKLRASPMMCQAVNRLAFSPDGELLASSGYSDQAVRLWSTATGQEVIATNRGGRVESLSVTSDGGRLAWRAETLADSMALVWDVAQGKPIFETHGLNITQVGLSRDGQWLSTGEVGSTGIPRVWDLTRGKEVRTTTTRNDGRYNGRGAALDPQGTQVAVAEGAAVDVWDVKQGKKLLRFDKHTENISALDWCAAKNWIASASHVAAETKIWDATTGDELVQLQDQIKVTSLCFRPDGSRLAVGATSLSNGAVYDLATGKRLFVTTGDGGGKHAKRFSPDSRTFAVGTALGQLSLRDATTGETRRQWQLAGAVTSIAFAPDGGHLLVGMGNSTIYVLRLGVEASANVGAKLNATQPNASQPATPPAKATTP